MLDSSEFWQGDKSGGRGVLYHILKDIQALMLSVSYLAYFRTTVTTDGIDMLAKAGYLSSTHSDYKPLSTGSVSLRLLRPAARKRIAQSINAYLHAILSVWDAIPSNKVLMSYKVFVVKDSPGSERMTS